MTITEAKEKTEALQIDLDGLLVKFKSSKMFLEPGIIHVNLSHFMDKVLPINAIHHDQYICFVELQNVIFSALLDADKLSVIDDCFKELITIAKVEIWHSEKMHRISRGWSIDLWSDSGLENYVELDLFPVLQPHQLVKLRNSMWNFLSYLTNSSTL